MIDTCKYYYIIYLIDSNDQLTFISNTDPITYSNNIKSAKLYEDEINVNNDILLYYEKMRDMIRNTDVESFYKGYIRINNGNSEIVMSNKII
jgi:hypothetical protein